MSALTKTFVVLQVILSIALTAAIVVYVNRENEIVKARDALQTQSDTAVAGQRAAEQALTAAQLNLEAIQQQANDQVNRMRNQVNDIQRQMADLNVQLAKSESTGATQLMEIARLSEGAKAAMDMASQLNQAVVQLRERNDQLLNRSAEMSATISDLQNKLDVTERQRRDLAEQLAEAQGQAQRFSAIIKDHNIPLDTATPAGVRTGALDIKGVIRARHEIAGVPYASISVGSADDVQEGMRFHVIDRQSGDFLGTLIVDSVEPNEATGRLAGPRLTEIREGHEVRTQF